MGLESVCGCGGMADTAVLEAAALRVLVQVQSPAPYRGVAQLIERVVWDHEAAGLSPVTPTRR